MCTRSFFYFGHTVRCTSKKGIRPILFLALRLKQNKKEISRPLLKMNFGKRSYLYSLKILIQFDLTFIFFSLNSSFFECVSVMQDLNWKTATFISTCLLLSWPTQDFILPKRWILSFVPNLKCIRKLGNWNAVKFMKIKNRAINSRSIFITV